MLIKDYSQKIILAKVYYSSKYLTKETYITSLNIS